MQCSDSLERLKALFRELLQLDVADLDFGLYRLFHLKKTEVEAFLNEQLPSEVEHAFTALADADADLLRKQVEDLAKRARETVADDAILPTGEPNPAFEKAKAVKDYLEARKKLQSVEISEIRQSEVFNLLYGFFSRYYEAGDFIPRRCYGMHSSYSVPYNGEEVLFHWANKDQYFIKTHDTFRDYSFQVPSVGGAYQVRFCLVEASLPKDNTKGETRFFFPRPKEISVDETGRYLRVPFHYRLPTEMEVAKYGKNSKGQGCILDEAAPKILGSVQDEFLRAALAAPSPTGRELEGEDPPTLLRRRLAHFTKKNTTDYFIHKDLQTFLRQELEFFLRDQVVHAADFEGDFDTKRGTLHVFRKIADTVINFLAQVEEAQKRLFTKKKLVLQVDYIVQVGRIPQSLWPKILANRAQVDEWKELFGTSSNPEHFGIKGKVTPKVLEQNPTLTIDTRHFNDEFKLELLEPIEDLDSATEGLLIQSENFQALSLLQARYREGVKCVVIDPPYNRLGDGFPYKDKYQHSSWLSMIYDRLDRARPLMEPLSALFSNIDENERDNLLAVLDMVFGKANRIEELIWAQNTTHSQSPLYSTNHEYVEVYAKDRVAAERAPAMFREPKPGFREVMELCVELNPRYPSIPEIEQAVQELFERHIEEFKAELQEQGLEYDEETQKQDPWRGLYNYCHAEYRGADGELAPESAAREKSAKIVVWRESDPSAPAQKQSESTRDPADPNYRFYRPEHPITGRPCAIPKRGWAWPHSWPDGDRDCFEELDKAGRIVWGEDEAKIPQYKRFLHDVETNVAKSFFHDYTDGEKQIAALFGETGLFPTPKPTTLPARFISQVAGPSDVVLDHFAGSGTTGHAVIGLNRDDGGTRKFILVEMGDYFDTVLVPRIKKVMLTPDWKDGRPTRKPTQLEIERSPKLVKVLRLESYEDALHNTFSEKALEQSEARERAFKGTLGPAEYRVRYLVKLPLQASASLLSAGGLAHPFTSTLEILTDGGPRPQVVDLAETFIWLYGLRVERISTWCNAKDKGGPDRGGRRYLVVTGWDRAQKKRTLVVWRDLMNLDPKVERPFLESKVSGSGVYDEQLINGDTAAKGFRSLDGLFKRLLEESAG